MTTFEDIWRKLAKSKKYRQEFALALLKRSVPFQIRTLRKRRCGSQAILAERAGLTQGVVSRAEDQDYGNLTFNTVGRIAGGLDMAFVGKFVPFSELAEYSLELSEDKFTSIPTFDEEDSALQAQPETASIGTQEKFRHESTLVQSEPSAQVKGMQLQLELLPQNVTCIDSYTKRIMQYAGGGVAQPELGIARENGPMMQVVSVVNGKDSELPIQFARGA